MVAFLLCTALHLAISNKPSLSSTRIIIICAVQLLFKALTPCNLVDCTILGLLVSVYVCVCLINLHYFFAAVAAIIVKVTTFCQSYCS